MLARDVKDFVLDCLDTGQFDYVGHYVGQIDKLLSARILQV